MEPIKQEYYILSTIKTPKSQEYLCFATEPEVNGVLLVASNVKEAHIFNSYSNEDDELIYLEKETVDALTFGIQDGSKYVLNSRSNRIKLGLKYKNELIQRATGTGVKEDYVLILSNQEEDKLALRFLGNHTDHFITVDLRKAGVKEPTPNFDTVYISTEKAERLATVFPDGSKVLLKTIPNLKQLGLEYKEGILQQSDIEEEPEPIKEEASKKEEEKTVDWMGIALKAASLFSEVEEAFSQPKSTTNNRGLNVLADEIHQINRDKGFWDKKRNVGEMLMLVTSELGEGMEALRKKKFADMVYYHEALQNGKSAKQAFEQYIKDSFEDELADATMRLLDLATGLHINLEQHIRLKMDYNRSRERLHGKAF